MAPMRTRPTLRDVAQAAGVSLGTASNAFNRPELLSEASREKVFEHARNLNYSGPDPAARRLRTGRTGALGLVFADRLPLAFEDAAATCFMGGIAGALEPAGLSLLVIPAGPDVQAAAEVTSQAAVDAFLVYSVAAGDPRLQVVLERGLPAVTVDQPRQVPTPFVGIDDRGAAREAAVHLRELGHERVAILAFPATAGDSGDLPLELSGERLEGYREGLGSAWNSELVRTYPSGRSAEGARMTAELLGLPDPPTAILAMGDELAIGALTAAREAGFAVPERLSIVGFDDSHTARVSMPALTSVYQPLTGKGEAATKLLLPSLLGETRKLRRRQVILETKLVVRGSSGPPA